MYESEHTRFMREWLKKHPEELVVAREGRALWWDQSPITPDAKEKLEEVRVAQKPYVYS